MRYALATEYMALGKEEDALQIFTKLIHTDPMYFATYFHLGRLYESLGKLEEAERTYETGLSVTKELGEDHAHRELRAVYDELLMD